MGTTAVQPSASLTIPADYLEDVRGALAAEIDSDGDQLRTEQARALPTVNGRSAERFCREDRDGAVRLLHNDLRILDELLGATDDTEVTAERETLFHVLEAMCRLLTDRLNEHMPYGPLDMAAVLGLARRLGWAATEASRIYPESAVS